VQAECYLEYEIKSSGTSVPKVCILAMLIPKGTYEYCKWNLCGQLNSGS